MENEIKASIIREEMIFWKLEKDRSNHIKTVMKGISPQVIENKNDVVRMLLADIILKVIP